MNKRFDTLGTGITSILSDMQRMEADRREQIMRD